MWMPFVSLNPMWIHNKIMSWLWDRPFYNQFLNNIKKKWLQELIDGIIDFFLLILCWIIAIVINGVCLLLLVLAVNYVVNGNFDIF